MTRPGRPQLRLITGGLAGEPEVMTHTPSAHRVAARVVAAAQVWASAVLVPGVLEGIDTATEMGRCAVALLDAVDELEALGAGMQGKLNGEGDC